LHAISISDQEYLGRVERVRATLRAQNVDAMCVFGATNILYLTGFAHIQTERPLAFIIPREGEVFALIPSLEEENIQERKGIISKAYVYPEYPSSKHPMSYLFEALQDQKLDHASLAADADGYPSIWGYQGPSLSSLLRSGCVTKGKAWIDEMRRLKSEDEISLLRESAKLGNLAHSQLQSAIEVGKPEIEVSLEAAKETTQVMLKMYGSQYVSKRWNASPAFAFLIAGPKTSLPHALPSGRRLQRGDTIITSCSAEIGGYMAEMERTLFLGDPTPEQAKYFELMLQARERAFCAIAPGRSCSEVDQAVSEFLESRGCGRLTRHHVGHALGLEPHEAPFLDEGDSTVLEPGMVFSVEPGLYVQGVGGFRHSDTVVVTQDGAGRLTYYPTDIGSLTVMS
jgi:Xaa-Pro dipeptidase